MEQIFEKLQTALQEADLKLLVVAAVIFVIIDVIVGIYIAMFIEKDFTSGELQLGSCKKILFTFVVIPCFILDFLIRTGFEVWPYVLTRFYSITIIMAQVKSLYENISRVVGLPDFTNLIKGDKNNE